MKSTIKLRILLVPFIVLTVMTLLLLAERTGLQFIVDEEEIEYLPSSVTSAMKAEQEAECLMLIDTSSDTMLVFREQMQDVLDEMSIGYRVLDISKEALPDLTKYRTVVITFYDLDVLADDVLDLFDWVEEGGGLMFCCAPQPSTVFQVIQQKIGILESGNGYTNVGGMMFVSDFMLGAKGKSYMWADAWDASLAVVLQDSCITHVVSVGKSSTPMVWEYGYGDGKVVVNNHYVADRASRGLACASYSLLEDVVAYPVINTSTFFIDDFPSPVPMGDSKYITQYGSIDSFYKNVWWPDILELSEEYDFTYTGVVIETYSDITDPPFEKTTDIERFTYFGGMLLDSGGEIGIHGYNHQPLVTNAFDFEDRYTYNKFDDMDVMTASLNELVDFTQSLYPNARISVYVPPSNVLSNEGREVLGTRIPGIRCIASVYISENIEFEQEFNVSDDGIINLPRVISGCMIDNYMEWCAMNELNMHFVNSHFMHPDDVLDPDRGATMGWEAMKGEFADYLEWLYTAAPNIRNMNASQAAAAVERYDYITVDREITDDEYKLSLGGFYDIAYLMVRINEGVPGEVEGGTLESLGGNLYLLCAKQANISIEIMK